MQIPRRAQRIRHARRPLASLALALALCVPAPPRASDVHESIAGIWRMDVSKLMADATVFLVIAADRSCQQAVKIRLLGFTKWTARTCTWHLDGDILTLLLQKSATPADETETMARITVAEVTLSSLVISSDGELQRWTRATDLPPEFRAHLQAVSAQ